MYVYVEKQQPKYMQKRLKFSFRDIGHFRRKSPIANIANFPHPRVLNTPDEGVLLGIWYRRKGS